MKNNILFLFIAAFIVLATISAVSATVTITNVKLNQGGLFGITAAPSAFTLGATVTNTGTTREVGIVELGFFVPQLAYVFPQDTCNPSYPYNVHQYYIVDPGQSVNINLQATVPPGTWNAVITHATTCCTDGVNSYACAAKSPYGFESSLGTYVVGNPGGNAAKQCSTDYDAGQYLASQGTLNCAVAQCQQSTGTTGKAVCVTQGVCNTGAVQTQVCPDNSSINIRTCNAAQWVTTGATCPTAPTPPAPAPVGGNNSLVYVGVLAIAGLGAWFVFKK